MKLENIMPEWNKSITKDCILNNSTYMKCKGKFIGVKSWLVVVWDWEWGRMVLENRDWLPWVWVLFWGGEIFFIVVMVVNSEHIKNHWIVHFTWVISMIGELYLNKTVNSIIKNAISGVLGFYSAKLKSQLMTDPIYIILKCCVNQPRLIKYHLFNLKANIKWRSLSNAQFLILDPEEFFF